MTQLASIRGYVSGRVQGVGFRYFVMRHARAEGIDGYVRNLRDGRVEFLLQGPPDAVARVIEVVRIGPAHARVTGLDTQDVDAGGVEPGFVIR